MPRFYCLRKGLFFSQRLGFLPRARALAEQASNGRGAIKMAMVPRRRLELPRPNGHWHLKPARLPIPPPGLAIDLAENRSLSDGVRIATNDFVSNLFNGLIARKYGFHWRCQTPVTIYFMGNWLWWDCKEGRHDLICSQWMRGGGSDTDCAANKLDQRAAPNGGSSKGKKNDQQSHSNWWIGVCWTSNRGKAGTCW